MTKLEAVTEAIYDALANHHRINWSQAEAAARAALAVINNETDEAEPECAADHSNWFR